MHRSIPLLAELGKSISFLVTYAFQSSYLALIVCYL